MGFTALFAVFASAAGIIIGMKPAIDIDCKYKGQYQCDKSMVKTLKIQLNVCS